MSRFILMLTHSDRTVADAHAVYQGLRGCRLDCVGFKDIGLPMQDLATLTQAIHDDGRTAMLEVVSSTRETELASIQAAVHLGVDYVLGGRHATEAVALLRGTGIRYFPFAGHTVGHPTRLVGSIDAIVADAQALAAIEGVHGLDLLAYRFDGNVPELTRRVVQAVNLPVIAAGSIDRLERIEAMQAAGAWGFTVGSALFDATFAVDPIAAQVNWILAQEGVVG
jgi:2,4-dienoyl-CoA reductase-like NADH-dependent reductase (Old Yellow Enzyme family)